MRLPRKSLCFVTACSLAYPVGARAEFALRDGDTLAFLGDSITAARGYTKIVEHYTLMRFPGRAVRFVNAGQGGDTAQGCLSRIQHDVFDRGATVVTVAFGINDIGWGTKADDEHRKRYLDGVREIISRCKERGVRPVICSPAITAEPGALAEKGYLQAMADDGLALAESLGAATIDIQRGMRLVQRTIEKANAAEQDRSKHASLHVEDGVHLNDLGQLAMGYAMLLGLGAPGEVSSVEIDASKAGFTETVGCSATGLSSRDGGLTFERLDSGWPLTLGPLSSLQFRWVPLQKLNGYRLAVRNLPPGMYDLFAGGRPLGSVDASELAEGINLTTRTADPWVPGGPWNVQSDMVKELVDGRDYVGASIRQHERFADAHPRSGELDGEFQANDDALVELQRSVARPYSYRMEIRPAAEGAAPPGGE